MILQFWTIPSYLEGPIEGIKEVWGEVWWIAAPLMSFFIFWKFWVLYIQYRFVSSIQWTLLDIKVPKNILKTPKAMEQIFAAAHATYSYGLRFTEVYWEGLVEHWMSFEIVGRSDGIHFYLRVPTKFKNLMESAIYAQYPESEITEVPPEDDYIKKMPSVLPNKTYDLYGEELILKEPNCYPIRTYPMFEESIEERRVDPIAGLMEVMYKLKKDEQIWIQILIRPTGDDWKKEGQEIIDKLTGKEKPPKPSLFGVKFQEVIKSPLEHPSLETDKKEQKVDFRLLMLTPGQREIIEGIERKTAKLGFETTIRFLYIDKRDSFSRNNVAAIIGFFRQFNTQNLNLFRPDKKTMTRAVHYYFVNLRLRWRKRIIFEKYKWMIFNPKRTILNIEELATLYHFPIEGVPAPVLERVESKRSGPPLGLPVIKNEE